MSCDIVYLQKNWVFCHMYLIIYLPMSIFSIYTWIHIYSIGYNFYHYFLVCSCVTFIIWDLSLYFWHIISRLTHLILSYLPPKLYFKYFSNFSSQGPIMTRNNTKGICLTWWNLPELFLGASTRHRANCPLCITARCSHHS